MSSAPPSAADGGPRILVSGWAGAGNVGDELLTRAIVGRLRGLGAQPVIASRDPAQTCAQHDVESIPWGPRGLGALDRIDGVCIGPGGILQDSSSLWSLPGHLAVALGAERRGLPVASIGVGAEPLRRRSSRWLLRRALAEHTVVTRDEASSAALRRAGLTVTTGADVVFGLELPGRRSAPTDEIVVSVGGGVRPGLVSPASRRVEPAPVGEIAAAVDRLAAALDARVVLARFRGPRDAEAAADLHERLTADSEVLPPDVDEHVHRVCGARLVVSSRYHPVVLAARAGVATIVVSGQPKLVSLVAQIDRPWVRSAGSWPDIGPETIPPAPDGEAVVIEGIERAHDALARLVAEAAAARSERSRG